MLRPLLPFALRGLKQPLCMARPSGTLTRARRGTLTSKRFTGRGCRRRRILDPQAEQDTHKGSPHTSRDACEPPNDVWVKREGDGVLRKGVLCNADRYGNCPLNAHTRGACSIVMLQVEPDKHARASRAVRRTRGARGDSAEKTTPLGRGVRL